MRQFDLFVIHMIKVWSKLGCVKPEFFVASGKLVGLGLQQISISSRPNCSGLGCVTCVEPGFFTTNGELVGLGLQQISNFLGRLKMSHQLGSYYDAQRSNFFGC